MPEPSNMNFLSLQGITFSYPGNPRPVLNDLNFTFNKEQRIGLIGPNGQGKTTFLHICLGLLKPAKGSLIFKGQTIKKEKQLIKLRKSLGLVFQNPEDQLFCPTVLEDVAFGPLNLGEPPDQAREIAMQALDHVGLKGYADRITHKLSGGEKKLLSIATILAMQPEAIFFDEPTSGLDPKTRSNLITLIQGLKQGFIIVSHDWDFLYQTTRELITLDQGQIFKLERAVLHQHVHLHPSGDLPHDHPNGQKLIPYTSFKDKQ